MYDMIIQVPEFANDSIICFSDEYHNRLKNIIQKEDKQHGIDLSQSSLYLNSYDFDDYLFVSSLVMNARRHYRERYFDSIHNQWQEGYSELPYIHVQLFEGNPCNLDQQGNVVFDDKKLCIKISPPDDNGNYTLLFDRYYLFRYIKYLQLIFDDNQEEVIDLRNLSVEFADGHEGSAEDSFKSSSKIGKSELVIMAHRYFSVGAYNPGKALLNLAKHLEDNDVIYPPTLFYKKDPDTGKDVFGGLQYYDEQRGVLTLPLKKTIYNTSGFSKYFEKRKDLILNIFVKSIDMIINHEVAHVGNGHFQLQSKEPDYVKQKDVIICMEQNADDTAIRWLIGNVLFQTENGDTNNPVLAYTEKELIHEWVMITFSAYMVNSWIFKDGERIWSCDTLDDYLNNDELTHPIYQFRTYNIVNRAVNLITEIAKINENPSMKEKAAFRTIDDKPLNRQMAKQAIDEILDMLNSFEASFPTTYNDNRNMEEIFIQRRLM